MLLHDLGVAILSIREGSWPLLHKDNVVLQFPSNGQAIEPCFQRVVPSMWSHIHVVVISWFVSLPLVVHRASCWLSPFPTHGTPQRGPRLTGETSRGRNYGLPAMSGTRCCRPPVLVGPSRGHPCPSTLLTAVRDARIRGQNSQPPTPQPVRQLSPRPPSSLGLVETEREIETTEHLGGGDGVGR